MLLDETVVGTRRPPGVVSRLPGSLPLRLKRLLRLRLVLLRRLDGSQPRRGSSVSVPWRTSIRKRCRLRIAEARLLGLLAGEGRL